MYVQKSVELNGLVSGEHGIGFAKNLIYLSNMVKNTWNL